MRRDWDAGRKEGRWDHQHLSDEERRRIDAGISDTMKSVVADQLGGRAYDPWRGSAGGARVTPVGAPVVKDLPEAPQGEPWKPKGERIDWIRDGAGRSGGVPLLPGVGAPKDE
jgi:hypothetical protein